MNLRSLLAAGAAVLVFACGGGGPAATTSQLGALSKKVEVTFWHALSGNLQTALQAQTDTFNSSQSNVHVTLVSKGAYSDLRKALLAAIAAGQPPTAAQCIENHAAKYQESSALADLGQFIDAKDGLSGKDKSDVFPVMLNDSKLKGKYYMFPFNKSTTVLYYNQDMFAAKGIAGPPATWDEFFTDVHKLADKNAGVVGAEAPAIDTWISMLYGYGGKLYDDPANPKKAAFNNDAGLKATQLWYDAMKSGDAKVATGPSFPDQVDFQNQKSAMYIASQVSYQFIVKPIAGKFKFAEAPLPGGPSGVKDEMFGNNFCVFNKASVDEQHGAFLFAKWFTATDQTAAWAKTSSYMPVRQSAYDQLKSDYYASNPSQGVGVGMLSKGQLFVVPFTSSFDDQRDAMSNELNNVWNLRAEPKPSLDKAAQKVTDLLNGG